MTDEEQTSSPRARFGREADLISGANGRYPGVYQCRYALRFELWPDHCGLKQGRKIALERSMVLFDRLPAAPDLLRVDLCVLPQWGRGVRKKLLRLGDRAGLGKPACVARAKAGGVPSLYRELEFEESEYFYWRLTPSFRPKAALRERDTTMAEEAFFIDSKNHVIYHPYEDGADVAALDPHTVLYLYRELNDWILDYDRRRIDAVFAGLSPVNASEEKT